jgi:hypothetical protein
MTFVPTVEKDLLRINCVAFNTRWSKTSVGPTQVTRPWQRNTEGTIVALAIGADKAGITQLTQNSM